jgi:hypothetical protein
LSLLVSRLARYCCPGSPPPVFFLKKKVLVSAGHTDVREAWAAATGVPALLVFDPS